MVVKALEQYDASVHLYNEYVYDSDGNYYLIVHTSSSGLLVLSMRENPMDLSSPDVYSFKLTEDTSYLLYTSTDNYEWTLSSVGNGAKGDKVVFCTTSSKVNSLGRNIAIEIETTTNDESGSNTESAQNTINVYTLPADMSISDYPYNMVFYESGYSEYIVVFATSPLKYAEASSGKTYFSFNSSDCIYYVYCTDFTDWTLIKQGTSSDNFTVCDRLGEASQIQYNVVFNLIEDVTPTPIPTPEANYEQIVQAIMEVQKSNNEMIEVQQNFNYAVMALLGLIFGAIFIKGIFIKR